MTLIAAGLHLQVVLFQIYTLNFFSDLLRFGALGDVTEGLTASADVTSSLPFETLDLSCFRFLDNTGDAVFGDPLLDTGSHSSVPEVDCRFQLVSSVLGVLTTSSAGFTHSLGSKS